MSMATRESNNHHSLTDFGISMATALFQFQGLPNIGQDCAAMSSMDNKYDVNACEKGACHKLNVAEVKFQN